MENFYTASPFMSFLSFSIKKQSAPFKNSLTASFLLFVTMMMMGNTCWAQTPTISFINPDSGAPGILFTITGTNLSSLAALKIGGVTASAIVVSNTGTSLVGMVMPGAATGTVAVTTSGGTATSSDTFTVQNTSYPIVQQGTKLVATNGLVNPSQGWSVALSTDGKTALVGDYYDNNDAGASWVYTRTGNTWSQQAKLLGSGNTGNAWQGFSVALSADGNTAIIGGVVDASGKGAVWIFTRSGTTWTQQGNKLLGSDIVGGAWFGKSVSLSADGNTALVGGYWDNSNAGAAWIFTRSVSTWAQQGAKLVVTGAVGAAQQGTAVSLSADGNTAVMGSVSDNSNRGAAWVFTHSGNTYTYKGNKLVATGTVGTTLYMGRSVALSADGTNMLVGADGDASSQGVAWSYAIGVTYDGNGNTGGTVPVAQLETIGSSVTLATNTGTLVKTGNNFAGWNSLANGAGTFYSSGASIAFNGSLQLYAQWTPNNYMVSFNADGGSGTMANQTIAYLATANLKSNEFYRTGYI